MLLRRAEEGERDREKMEKVWVVNRNKEQWQQWQQWNNGTMGIPPGLLSLLWGQSRQSRQFRTVKTEACVGAQEG